MQLVFVHGMRQEGQDPEALHTLWRSSVEKGWARSGQRGALPESTMPFYGDELDRLTRALHAGVSVLRRGVDDDATSPTERGLLEELQIGNGVTDEAVARQLGAEVVAKGPANWEWVQATARAIEEHVPAFRKIGLRFVEQVDAYLNRPHIGAAVDGIVEPHFASGPVLVVAHSLGTIVAYRILRRRNKTSSVPLLLTLGSPLGINAVKDRLRPPALERPGGVARWLNGNDPRDYVALFERLDEQTFAAEIENITDMHNSREDAHAIADYLSDPRVTKAIARAASD
jgi:hypothetical protein